MIMCCSVVLLNSACSNEDGLTVKGNGNDEIILDMSMNPSFASSNEAQGAEVDVDHIDVLIFKSDDETKVWHERVEGCTPSQGKITLAAKRAEFDHDSKYWVYMIANSTSTAETFEQVANINALKSMMQRDKMVHFTGSNVPGAPENFLMDGIAYSGSELQEPSAPSAVVLNNGNSSDNTELKVVLRRAAAKILVTIKKGDKVTFTKGTGTSLPGYYLRNMPYSTSVIAGVNPEAELTTPDFSTGGYFAWAEESINVTAYAYEHRWADESSLEKEFRLVVNIPMLYDEGDGSEPVEPVPYNDCYYQIPVSKNKLLERNTCYVVSVTVNAPGATDPTEPMELTDVNYSVLPWNETTISVGGEDGRPVYLTVNEEEMEMHNITDDNTTLHFASSSDVSAKVTRVYYIDKFGQEQDERTSIVTVTPEEGLTGNINIHSPLPENNTIRYIEMEITNEDGVTRTVKVAQYPLEYITNILGWYSYRDDFGGTTYELLNGQDVEGQVFNSSNRITDWKCACNWEDNRWTYSKTGQNSSSCFFGSKVAGTVAQMGSNAGKAHIYYYRWTEESSGFINKKYTYYVGNGSDVWDEYANPRMYHVQITASSGDYTLGRPKITDGVTDSGKDNAQLVSPSFMIASQLGAVQAAENVDVAAKHCEQYVEVYKDPVSGETIHLKDWRLPTEAELKIIMKFQYSSDAMDEVLAGGQYWSASGLVKNTQKPNNKDRAIRCIRDAYGDPAKK